MIRKIRWWLIRKLAGEDAIILNTKIYGVVYEPRIKNFLAENTVFHPYSELGKDKP